MQATLPHVSVFSAGTFGWRWLARAFGMLLLLFLLADYLGAGSIPVETARLYDRQDGLDLRVTLPYSTNSYPQETSVTFVLTFKPEGLQYFRDFSLAPVGCITELTVNGITQTLQEQAQNVCASNPGVMISSKPQVFRKLKINATVRTTAPQLGLSLVAQRIAPQWLSVIMLLAGIWLLGVSMIHRRETLRRFHRSSLALTLFAAAALPYYASGADMWRKIQGQQTFFTLVFPILCLLYWRHSRAFFETLGSFMRYVARYPYAFLVVCMLVFLGMAVWISIDVFGRVAHVGDTHAQLLHSKIIASGRLYLPSHPLAQFFNFQTTINNGKQFSAYPPGHILILALGQLAGQVWLVNPLLGTLTVGAIFLLARELAGHAAGMVAAGLTLLSPFVLFMSGEYMNHSTCLLFATLFLYFYLRLLKTGKWRHAVLAGLCIGYAFISRPQTMLLFAQPVAFHAMWCAIRRPRANLLPVFLMALAFCGPVSFFLYYNWVLNGSPWILGGANPTIFATPFTSGERWGSLGNEVHRAGLQSSLLMDQLFAWPVSSLIFVLLLFLFRAAPRYCGIVIACCLAQWFSLIINPFFEGILGPRYLFETSGALIALTAVCLVRLPALLRAVFHSPYSRSAVAGMLASTVLAMSLYGVFNLTRDLYRVYQDNYWEGNVTYLRVISSRVEQPALIFMKNYPEYRLLFDLQPPLESNPIILALDRGKDNMLLMNYYPYRNVYEINGWEIKRVR